MIDINIIDVLSLYIDEIYIIKIILNYKKDLEKKKRKKKKLKNNKKNKKNNRKVLKLHHINLKLNI